MGANAVTTFPTYTTGQVLEAADLNITNCGVPTFADSTARDGAFGGTGEKTLAEGQLVYLENSNIVQYYDGSNWLTLGPSSPGGLVYLTGASFSSVASVSLPNDTFTSSYKNYRLIAQLTASASNANVTGRFRDAGSDITSAEYYQGSPGLQFTGSASNQADNGTTAFTLGINSSAFPEWAIAVDFISPFEAGGDKIIVGTFWGGTIGRMVGLRFYDAGKTLTIDSFSLIFSANSTGWYRVYGYADS
jgi:hypothetical protein